MAYLKAAASGKRLPPAQVLAAILALEKAKLPVRTLGLHCHGMPPAR